MTYTFFDILRFLIKRKWIIVVTIVVFLFGGNYYVSRKQSYTAETVIEYTGNGASAGYTPNGSKIDINEITSANIISEVIQQLGLNVSTEAIRGNCSIDAIIPADVKALKEAKEKDGEEYSYFPTKYVVSYTANSSKDGAYARNVLDAIISTYINYYGEKHVSQYGIARRDEDIQNTQFDYIERLDILKDSIDAHTDYLSNKLSSNTAFRSSTTGYSLNDLYDKYVEIKNLKLPALYSEVLNARVTLNQDALIKRYEYKKEQATLESALKSGNSGNALDLMGQFVEKNKEIPNSYSVGDEENRGSYRIMDDVYDNDSLPRGKNTYDKLVDQYVEQGVGSEDLTVDIAYYQTVIDQFQSGPPNMGAMQSVKDSLDSLVQQVIGLEDITQETIKEYAQSDVSHYISLISSITMRENVSTNFYLLVALAAGALLGCILAIFIEIVHGFHQPTNGSGRGKKQKNAVEQK